MPTCRSKVTTHVWNMVQISNCKTQTWQFSNRIQATVISGAVLVYMSVQVSPSSYIDSKEPSCPFQTFQFIVPSSYGWLWRCNSYFTCCQNGLLLEPRRVKAHPRTHSRHRHGRFVLSCCDGNHWRCLVTQSAKRMFVKTLSIIQTHACRDSRHHNFVLS